MRLLKCNVLMFAASKYFLTLFAYIGKPKILVYNW